MSSRTARVIKRNPVLKNKTNKQKTQKTNKKNNEFIKLLDKWMNLEDIILSEITQSQKNTHDMHSLISGHSPRNLEYPR